MNKVNGGVLLARVLKANTIDTVFTLHGGHLDAVYLANVQGGFGISFIDCRHEATAGHAADGYARSAGRVGVAMVTAGPGFSNVVTAITNAWLDCIPTVFIAGAPPLRDSDTNCLQGGFDQVAMVKPVTKWAGRASQTHLIVSLLQNCIRTAKSGRPGPVFLEIPVDVLFGEINDVFDAGDFTTVAAASPSAPTGQALREAVAAIRASLRPVVCAGGGALLGGAEDALRRFVTLTRFPVYTNNKAHGILPGNHPLACGKISNLAAMNDDGGERPDLVLMLGARFGLFTGGITDRVIPKSATVIHVDIESSEIGKVHRADIAIAADCRITLEQLNESLARDTKPASESWQRRARLTSRWHERAFADAPSTDATHVHPYHLAKEVFSIVGDAAIYIADGGNNSNWTELNANVSNAGHYIGNGYLGCLGTGPGMAIGAQIAHADRRVMLLTGDGAFGLHIGDLDTMVRHRLPIVTVVGNNSGWGMSFQGQDLTFPKGIGHLVTDLNATRYDLVAAALGCHGEHVETPAELGPALARALASGKPALVNVAVDATPIAPQLLAYISTDTKSDEIILPYYGVLKAT